MSLGVVLDTSYLITLADPTRSNHETSRKYWRYFLEQNIPIFLPTIVVSEFYQRQEIQPEILRCCIILPFNWSDAIKTAELDFNQFKGEGINRTSLKDDIKILAQTAVVGVNHLITDDVLLFDYTKKLREGAKVNFTVIKLEDSFDPAFFNDGQRELAEDFGKSPE